MIEQSLGTSLRYLREQNGISQRTLAERTDFSASFLSQIENGQCSPSISSMEKIVNALRATLGQFFLSANQQVVNIRARQRTHAHGARLFASRDCFSGLAFPPIAVPGFHDKNQARRPNRNGCHPVHF